MTICVFKIFLNETGKDNQFSDVMTILQRENFHAISAWCIKNFFIFATTL